MVGATTMAFANPAINPPHLSSPTKRSLLSRSPSHSPVRRYARDGDPLLRDLSPTAALHAFTTGPDATRNDQLAKSIQTATHSQKLLGAKSAQACADLRSWARELAAWEWPGTFEVPEPARKKQRMSTMSVGSLLSRRTGSLQVEEDDEYWGSLEARTVKAHTRRLDEINEDLDEIDVEELKDFVLSAHSQAGIGEASVDDSIGTIGAATDLARLDDFTALITAIILQALPYLSRLTSLLHIWTVRLAILRSAPSYLFDLKQARTDLDHGWAALAISPNPSKTTLESTKPSFSRGTMMNMKQVIETQVHSLGRRLDRFLDELEGRQDCVPNAWIEDFEVLEEQYGEWVVQAERKVLESEWRIEHGRHADVETPDMEHAAEVGAGRARDANGDRTDSMKQEIIGEAVATSAIAGALLSKPSPIDTDLSAQYEAGQRSASSNTENASPTRSQRSRSRHVPIVVEYSDPVTPFATNQTPPAGQSLDLNRDISPMPSSAGKKKEDEPSSGSKVKKRAAFLNSDIEKTGALNKEKPAPIVRPFEHASNAFTRLFKRDSRSSGESGSISGASAAASAASATDTKRSSSSSKGTKISARPESTTRSSYSGKRTGYKWQQKDASDRYGYMDMVRAPEDGPRLAGRLPTMPQGVNRGPQTFESAMPRRSVDRSRASKSTAPWKRGAYPLEYGDMVLAPDPSRRSMESQRRGRSPPKALPPPLRSSEDTTRNTARSRTTAVLDEKLPEFSRPKSSKRDSWGTVEAVPRSATDDEARRSRPTTPKHVGNRPIFESPVIVPRVNVPDPKKQPTPRQSLTALPQTRSQERLIFTAKSSAPQTYRPTGMKSAPAVDENGEEFPADWPLSANATPMMSPALELPPKLKSGPGGEESDSGPEIASPNEAMDTNVFEGMMLASLPNSPEQSRPTTSVNNATDQRSVKSKGSPRSKRATSLREIENRVPSRDLSASRSRAAPSLDWNDGTVLTRDRSFSRPKVSPSLERDKDRPASSSPDFRVKAASDRSLLRTGVSDSSRRFDFSPSPTKPRPVSIVREGEEGSTPDSPVGDDEHGRGLKDATNAADYFGALGMSRASSSATVKPIKAQRAKSTPPVSPSLLRLRIPGSPTSATAGREKLDRTEELIRRASATSIESFPRSELRSIDVPRRGDSDAQRQSSSDSTSGAQDRQTEVDAEGGSSDQRTPVSPTQDDGIITFQREDDGLVTFQTPPSVPPRRSSMRSSTEMRRSLDAVLGAKPPGLPSSSSARVSASSSPRTTAPPLNQGKRRYNETPSRRSAGKVEASPLKPGEDNFDRHVSEVLDRVHAPIKFRTRPGAETPLASRTAEAKNYSGPRPKAERPGNKGLTLAPADISPKKSNAAESGVKLYHLTQAGKSEPIKLFIRLVGEGERVMVRVGGGWADLADYLRQYAEHHGSRTISENDFRLQTASAPGSGSGANGQGRRTFSGPVEPKSKARMPRTPTGAHPLERPRTASGEPGWLRQPQPEFSMGDSLTDDDSESPTLAYHRTVRDTAFGASQSTPKSAASASRPSTANGSRPQSRHAEGGSPSLGLAGPGGKARGDLPEQKVRWVEGMIQKVNKSATASAEKNREGKEQYFGEMGRVGGTRRMIFRSTSGVSSGGAGDVGE